MFSDESTMVNNLIAPPSQRRPDRAVRVLSGQLGLYRDAPEIAGAGDLRILLEPELPDCRLDLGTGLRDDRAQFVRGRRYGNGAGTLGDRAVVRRGDDGRDLAIEPADDGRRRPRRGADPEPAEADEIDALFPQG